MQVAWPYVPTMLYVIIYLALSAAVLVCVFVSLVFLIRRFYFARATDPRKCTLAFFHPYW